MSSRGMAAALVVLAVAVFGVSRVLAASAPPSYRTVPVRRADVSATVSITGAVQPATETRLSFKIPGRIAATLVSVGDRVSAGQPLARLESGDLEIAAAQANAGLSAAQAKYDLVTAGAAPEDIAVARQTVDNARRTLDATRQETATDVASAQLSFSKLKSAYASAQTGFQLLGDAVPTDVGSLTSSFGAARSILATALVDFTTMSTADITTAKAALGQADAAMSNAQNTTPQITNALAQWTSARDAVVAAWRQFDDAVARGTDTSGAVTQYQSAQLAYANATTQLQSTVTAAVSQVVAAQTSVAVAQGALNSSTSGIDAGLDQVRSDLGGFQSTASAEGQLAAAIAAKLAQMTGNAAVVGDATGGSYLAAEQAVASAQDRGASAVTGAQNAYDSAAAVLAKAGAPARSFDVAAAYAGVLSAQAAIDKAASDLANTTLTAPAAAVVASLNGQVGELVGTAGAASPVVVLYDTSTVTLHGTVGETDVAKLRLGQSATVSIDAIGTRMTGRVTTIDPAATIQQGVPVYALDVTIDRPDPGIRVGMAGTVSIVVASIKGVLVVPTYAIRDEDGTRTVAVLRGATVVDVPVQLGIADDDVTQATGVAEGDAVLVPLLTGTTIRSTPARP